MRGGTLHTAAKGARRAGQAAALSALLGACGASPPTAPSINKGASSPAPAAPTPTPTPAPAPASPAAGSGDATPAGGVDTVQTEADFSTTCGLASSATPGTDLVTETLAGLPVSSSASLSVLGFPVPYTVSTVAGVKYQESLAQLVQALSYTATASDKIAQTAAQTAASLGAGTVTETLLGPSGRTALGAEAAPWSGVHCTILPATGLTAAVGAASVTASFSPPLPVAVSPAFAADLYAAELGAPRSFTDLTATVVSSTAAALPTGTKLTGTATITPIGNAYAVTLSDGSKQTVGGDLGFEVQLTFGTPVQMAALGLPAVTRYFVDTTKHQFKAIVVDAGNGAPEEVLIAQ